MSLSASSVISHELPLNDMHANIVDHDDDDDDVDLVDVNYFRLFFFLKYAHKYSIPIHIVFNAGNQTYYGRTQ